MVNGCDETHFIVVHEVTMKIGNKNKQIQYYPSFKTLWASLKKSSRFVPISERQNTATSTLEASKGTYNKNKDN